MQLLQPIKPMLLEKSEIIPQGDRINMVKLDGFRTIFSYVKGQGLKIFTRHSNEITHLFPEFHIDLPVQSIILDGETVVIQQGKNQLELALKRLKSKKSLDQTLPASLLFFDILWLNGQPLTHLPLTQRLDILHSIRFQEPLGLCPTHPNGHELFEATKRLGWEGITTKVPSSTYKIDQRSKNWLKVKHTQITKASIIGFKTAPFRVLIERDQQTEVLQFISPSIKKYLYALPFNQKRNQDFRFLQFELPCEIKHHGFTSNGLLRDGTINQLLG